jgi:uncharacterized repeat protein (TIGR04076 family)
MILNQITCEVVNVNTDSGICPGLAKTEKGETYIIDARTPSERGICCQAFTAMSSMKLAMMYTEKMEWEKKEYFDIVCPHGFVTFRLSRMTDT